MNQLQIKRITRPAKDAVTLWFDVNSELSNYKPGQFLTLSCSIGDGMESRSYSINTSPYEDKEIAVTIRQIPGGKFSNYMAKNAFEGMAIGVDGPNGAFTLVPVWSNKRYYVFFAGGSGITPIFSMIRSLLYNEPQSRAVLLYANQDYERIIFREEIRELQQVFDERLSVYHALSRPDEVPIDFDVFFKGRLNRLVVKKIVKQVMAESAIPLRFYLCGPHDFMGMIIEALATLGVEPSVIHKENFYTPPQTSGIDFDSLPATEVIIRWNSEDGLVQVRSGESILTAALKAGVGLPHSCRAGQCGTCRSWLISGEVEMRTNHILTEPEIREGQVLLCEGFPTSNHVVISSNSPAHVGVQPESRLSGIM